MRWLDTELALRRLTSADVPLLSGWLSDPRVLAFYEGRDHPFDEDAVRNKFIARNDGDIVQQIVLYRDSPIGYLQFYPLDDAGHAEYGYSADISVYGMDLFIGEPDYWNRGIGTRLVTGVAAQLLSSRNAGIVTLDPRTDNVRAIRCYEKAGFRIVRLLPRHEQHEDVWHDCWLMERSAPAITPEARGVSRRAPGE